MRAVCSGLLILIAFQAWLGGAMCMLFGASAYLDRFLGRQLTPELEQSFWIGLVVFTCSFPIGYVGERLGRGY